MGAGRHAEPSWLAQLGSALVDFALVGPALVRSTVASQTLVRQTRAGGTFVSPRHLGRTARFFGLWAALAFGVIACGTDPSEGADGAAGAGNTGPASGGAADGGASATGGDTASGGANGGTTGGAPGSGGAGSGGQPGGAGCKVGEEIYPDGAGSIPDPFSCNTCTCENGQLNARRQRHGLSSGPTEAHDQVRLFPGAPRVELLVDRYATIRGDDRVHGRKLGGQRGTLITERIWNADNRPLAHRVVDNRRPFDAKARAPWVGDARGILDVLHPGQIAEPVVFVAHGAPSLDRRHLAPWGEGAMATRAGGR